MYFIQNEYIYIYIFFKSIKKRKMNILQPHIWHRRIDLAYKTSSFSQKKEKKKSMIFHFEIIYKIMA